MALQYLRADKIADEVLQATVIQSYSTYSSILAPADWANMKSSLENQEAIRALRRMSSVFLCRHGSAIVGIVYLVRSGIASAFFQADWAQIRLLAVLPEYRGRGIGEQLMRLCIEEAKKNGEHTLALHTSGFQGAWRMYERLGFVRQKDLGIKFGHMYWLYTRTL